MQNMSEFFSMGGYGGFVWSAYGVAALLLIGLAVISLRNLRARQAEVSVLEAASPRRRQPAEKVEPS